MRIEGFLHLFVNWHDLVDRVSLLFFVLVDYFELYLVQSLSVAYDVFIGLIQLTEFLRRVFNNHPFIRMNKFGFAPVRSPHFKIGAVLFNVENFIAIDKSHKQAISREYFNLV